jgi:plasmid stabilization system protein ParE
MTGRYLLRPRARADLKHNFLFYRLAGVDVEIVRILHEPMDFEQHIP